MVVRTIDTLPFHVFDHLTAAGSGKSVTLPIKLYRGVASGIPDDVDAIVVASDLQGVAPLVGGGGRLYLVGEVLAEQLAMLAECGEIPPLAKTGVILAGDLFSAPNGDVRGASGDVRDVWRGFAIGHRWVVGVAGNHDTFGTRDDQLRFARERRIHLLDGTCTTLDGLAFGGVGNIIGNARKPGRRDERDFLRAIRTVLAQRPAVLVLHHGPDANGGALRGHALIRAAVEAKPELLVICGHVYWPEPLATLKAGGQVLNVDGRVVVLHRE